MKQKKERQINSQNLSKYSRDLYPVVEKIVSGLGLRLLKISFINEYQTNYLRLTILHPDRTISLDDCELVSKSVEEELDNKDPIPFSYVLEVQSPGIEDSKADKEYKFEIKNSGLVVKA